MENEFCKNVACGFSSIKIDYFDSPKRLTGRINDVYVVVVVVFK